MLRSPTEINLAYPHSPGFVGCKSQSAFSNRATANVSCSISVFLSCWRAIPFCVFLSLSCLCLFQLMPPFSASFPLLSPVHHRPLSSLLFVRLLCFHSIYHHFCFSNSVDSSTEGYSWQLFS